VTYQDVLPSILARSVGYWSGYGISPNPVQHSTEQHPTIQHPTEQRPRMDGTTSKKTYRSVGRGKVSRLGRFVSVFTVENFRRQSEIPGLLHRQKTNMEPAHPSKTTRNT
jgi:hypothetical protein